MLGEKVNKNNGGQNAEQGKKLLVYIFLYDLQ